MQKKYIVVLVLFVLALGGFLLFKSENDGDEKMNMEVLPAPEVTTEQAAQQETASAPHAPTTVTFDVVGGNFYFTPKVLTVKKGDTVKINFKNAGGFHDFKIDEFGVASKKINDGEETSVQFVADKIGTFQYYCSVGSHREKGMWGTLTVVQ